MFCFFSFQFVLLRGFILRVIAVTSWHTCDLLFHIWSKFVTNARVESTLNYYSKRDSYGWNRNVFSMPFYINNVKIIQRERKITADDKWLFQNSFFFAYWSHIILYITPSLKKCYNSTIYIHSTKFGFFHYPLEIPLPSWNSK